MADDDIKKDADQQRGKDPLENGAVETSEAELLADIKAKLQKQTEVMEGSLGPDISSIKNVLSSMLDVQRKTLSTIENQASQDLTEDARQGIDNLREGERQRELLELFKEIRLSLGDININTEESADKKGGFLSGPLGIGAAFALGKFGIGSTVALSALGLGGGIAIMAIGLAKAAQMVDGLEFDGLKNAFIKTAEGLEHFDFEEIKKFGALIGGSALIGGGLTIAAGGGLKGALSGPLVILPALGMGISGFFGALMLGDKGLSYLGEVNGDFIRNGATIAMDVISVMGRDTESIVGVAALFATGGATAAFFGVGKAAAATAGIALLGAGISAFLLSFAASDKVMDMLKDPTPGNNLPIITRNIVDALQPIADSKDTMGILAGMMVTGGILGQFPSVAGKAAIGLGIAGAGIGAFFVGLAAMGDIAAMAGIDGEGIGNIIKNVGEGLASLDHGMFKTMLATGGIFAVVTAIPGGAAVAGLAAAGFGIAGAAIGAFFTGLAGIGDIAGAIGISGSGLKTMLINTGAGIKALDGIDGANLLVVTAGIAALGPALAVLYGSEGLGKIFGAAGKVLDTITFGFFSDDGKDNIFQRTADNLAPIKSLGSEFANAVTGIENITDGIKNLEFSEEEMDRISKSADFLLGMSLKVGNAANVITEGGNFSDINSALKEFGLDPDMPDYEFKGMVKIEGIDEAIESLEKLSEHLLVLPRTSATGFIPVGNPTANGSAGQVNVVDGSSTTIRQTSNSPKTFINVVPSSFGLVTGGPGS